MITVYPLFLNGFGILNGMHVLGIQEMHGGSFLADNAKALGHMPTNGQIGVDIV